MTIEFFLYIILPILILLAIGGFYYESMTPEEKKKWERNRS